MASITTQQSIDILSRAVNNLSTLVSQAITTEKLQQSMVVINNEFDRLNTRVDNLDPAQSIVDAMNIASENWVTTTKYNAFCIAITDWLKRLETSVSQLSTEVATMNADRAIEVNLVSEGLAGKTTVNASISAMTDLSINLFLIYGATATTIIDGLTGGFAGRKITLMNLDSSSGSSVSLVPVNTSSATVGNCFMMAADIILGQYDSITFQYASPSGGHARPGWYHISNTIS